MDPKSLSKLLKPVINGSWGRNYRLERNVAGACRSLQPRQHRRIGWNFLSPLVSCFPGSALHHRRGRASVRAAATRPIRPGRPATPCFADVNGKYRQHNSADANTAWPNDGLPLRHHRIRRKRLSLACSPDGIGDSARHMPWLLMRHQPEPGGRGAVATPQSKGMRCDDHADMRQTDEHAAPGCNACS